MPVHLLVEMPLLKVALSGSASVTERAWDGAAAQDPVAGLPFDFRQGADAEDVHGPFVHIDQFMDRYVCHVDDFVYIIKKSP